MLVCTFSSEVEPKIPDDFGDAPLLGLLSHINFSQVNMSSPLFLSCNASGFPEPKIRWEKSGITLSHTKQLNICSSNRNDAGEYVCRASNGVRQEKTVRAYVTVQCKSLFQYHRFHKKLPVLLNP